MSTGSTFFMRCGKCHTMFVPKETLAWPDGIEQPAWFRPPRHNAQNCAHTGPVERWNGDSWVEVARHTPSDLT